MLPDDIEQIITKALIDGVLSEDEVIELRRRTRLIRDTEDGDHCATGDNESVADDE